MNDLVNLYDKIKSDAESRNQKLEQTLGVSEKFWDDLNGLMGTLKDLQDTLVSLEPPALDPQSIREQQDALEVSMSFNNDIPWIFFYRIQCSFCVV